MTWEQWLLNLLCEIYKAFDGDCDDFNDDPATAVSVVVGAYQKSGAPAFPNPTALSAFLALLSALEAHLNLSGNTLAPDDTLALRKLIADLRVDLGVSP